MNQDKMLSQNAAETILSMITVEKRFSTGDRLPNETELAEELNISRTTLREAVKILTAYGVLEIQRGRGTYVTRDTLPQSPGLQSLTAVKVNARDLYEMRLIFDFSVITCFCAFAISTLFFTSTGIHAMIKIV